MTLNFLSKVLPDGLIVIARPAGKGFKQVVCRNIDEAIQQAQRFDSEGHDCYFGLGSLIAPSQASAKGKVEVRVGTNIAQLKCLFIDIDVEPDNDKKYPTQQAAIIALRDFCRSSAFPAPMVVSSGGGIHAYWPLDKAVDADQWRLLANTFKSSLAAYGLKADPTRTADASSVLRVVGTHNYKHGGKRDVALIRDVAPYKRKDIALAVIALADKYGVVAKAVRAKVPVVASAFGDNTAHVFEPSDFKPIMLACEQIKTLVLTGGDSEPIWYAGLQVTRHVEQPIKASQWISKNYAGYSEAEMYTKLNQLEEKDIGPATCAQFCTINPIGCSNCIYKGKITTPLQLGRTIMEAAPPVVEVADVITGVVTPITIPNPPFPYTRREGGGIVVKAPKDANGIQETMIVHDRDMYPMRRTYSERSESESTVWRVDQPITGWVEVTIEQAALADPHRLHGLLLAKGVYVTPGRLKLMVGYMVAYISELQKQAATEQIFSRLGWRDDHSKFVLDDKIYHDDGSITSHQVSSEIRSEIPGLRSTGTLEAWKEAIQFFNAPGHEAHRFMLYCAFGAPLLHMTGHKGMIVNALGLPGVGKSLVLQSVGSVWGHPIDMVINGTKAGTTPNAMYSLLSAYNNLPFPLDEITRMDPRVLGDFGLSVSQGQGKRINTRAGMLSRNVPSWATMVLTTSNTDTYIALAQNRRDATAETMRVLQIPFTLPSSHSKADADRYAAAILNNHGHAGHVFMQAVVADRDNIQEQVIKCVQLTDQKGKIASSERFYSAGIASATVGALIARRLGLLEGFPVEQDFKWAVGQVADIRNSMKEHFSSPKETLSEFLEARVGETLVLSQTTKQNISPRIDQMPRGALSIRHETDTRMVYIMKSEFKRFCMESGSNYGEIQDSLETSGVLINRNAQKVLGAGTDFSKGQVRCWMVSLDKLQGGTE